MGNPFFRFKRFTVYHDKCAMKVGTDGVLLGAWAHVEGAREVLDAGAGTGLIGLMVAQRNLSARITAVELNATAAEQARENVIQSPFADRMTVIGDDFRHYARTVPGKFDHVVCNPPYFTASLPSPDEHRTLARHAVTLAPDELLESAGGCLKEKGRLSLILPEEALDHWKETAREKNLFIKKITWVHPRAGTPPKRVLLEFTKQEANPPNIGQLTIETERHRYTEEFIALLKDFYLYF